MKKKVGRVYCVLGQIESSRLSGDHESEVEVGWGSNVQRTSVPSRGIVARPLSWH